MRNKLMHQSKKLATGILRTADNPFAKNCILSLFRVSANATVGKTLLSKESCIEQGLSLENDGLVIERYNSRIIYSSTAGVFDIDMFAQYVQHLIQSLKKEEIIYFRGNFTDPFTIENGVETSDYDGSKFVVQFTDTHRMVVTRRYKYRDVTKDSETGEPIVRNPMGLDVAFIPNEYVSRYAPKDAEQETGIYAALLEEAALAELQQQESENYTDDLPF